MLMQLNIAISCETCRLLVFQTRGSRRLVHALATHLLYPVQCTWLLACKIPGVP